MNDETKGAVKMFGVCVMLASTAWLFTLNWKIALAGCVYAVGSGLFRNADDL